MSGSGLMALWKLSRPKLTLYVMLLILAGYGWAHWDRALTTRGGWDLLVVCTGWWFLNAGTLWLNAALDQDEGEVLMGETVAPPPGIERWGYAALVVSVPICAVGDPVSGLAAVACAALAVLYSHPATVWKGHPVGGPIVNGVGYGLFTPLAGWAVVDVTLDARTAVAWILGMVGVLGCYFAAQAFQEQEDAGRGYRTLVATHGPGVTILTARLCIGAALGGGLVLAAVGWVPRTCLLIAPLVLWSDRWFAHWSSLPEGGSESDAREMARRLLLTGLAGLVLSLGVYFQQSWHGEPVAGLGTAAGHPPDRPLLPPMAMRAWEREQARKRLAAAPDLEIP